MKAPHLLAVLLFFSCLATGRAYYARLTPFTAISVPVSFTGTLVPVPDNQTYDISMHGPPEVEAAFSPTVAGNTLTVGVNSTKVSNDIIAAANFTIRSAHSHTIHLKMSKSATNCPQNLRNLPLNLSPNALCACLNMSHAVRRCAQDHGLMMMTNFSPMICPQNCAVFPPTFYLYAVLFVPGLCMSLAIGEGSQDHGWLPAGCHRERWNL